jgi:TolB-like protein
MAVPGRVLSPGEVLAGRFRVVEEIGQAGRGIQANIKISEARSGFQRWTRPYELAPDELYAVKDSITRDAASFLGGGEA